MTTKKPKYNVQAMSDSLTDFYDTRLDTDGDGHKPPLGYLEGKFIGVEIEFIPKSYRSLDFIKDNLTKLDVGHCDLKDDGSVWEDDMPTEDGGELTLLTTINDLDPIRKALKVIKINGDINPTCGLHVHLDMRHKTKAEARLIAAKMAKALPIMRKMVAPYRIKNSYCRRDIGYKTRYAAINASSIERHGTIEVRLHQGTLDYRKITNWINFLYKLSRAVDVPATDDPSVMASALKLNKVLSRYMNERIEAMEFLKNMKLPKYEKSEVLVNNYER